MSAEKRVTSLGVFLVFVAVFASAPNVRAQCGGCYEEVQQVTFKCSSAGCSGQVTVLYPDGPEFGTTDYACTTVYCCTAQIPTLFESGGCAVRRKETGSPTAEDWFPTYVFVRGCDGGYHLTAFASGS